jgi:hypothetical protein
VTTKIDESEQDDFEVSLRILGNEALGMKLSSKSKSKMWVAIAMICLVILAVVAENIIPLVEGNIPWPR